MQSKEQIKKEQPELTRGCLLYPIVNVHIHHHPLGGLRIRARTKRGEKTKKRDARVESPLYPAVPSLSGKPKDQMPPTALDLRSTASQPDNNNNKKHMPYSLVCGRRATSETIRKWFARAKTGRKYKKMSLSVLQESNCRLSPCLADAVALGWSSY